LQRKITGHWGKRPNAGKQMSKGVPGRGGGVPRTTKGKPRGGDIKNHTEKQNQKVRHSEQGFPAA